MVEGDSEVTVNELGDWLGCSVVNVRELVRRGAIEQTGHVKYLLKMSPRRYAAHMRKTVTGRSEGTPGGAKAVSPGRTRSIRS